MHYIFLHSEILEYDNFIYIHPYYSGYFIKNNNVQINRTITNNISYQFIYLSYCTFNKIDILKLYIFCIDN